MSSKIGSDEEIHKEKHADDMNNEAAKLQVKHTKVQHHNPQVEELAEETEESEGYFLRRG
jgi:hypothetical protein